MNHDLASTKLNIGSLGQDFLQESIVAGPLVALEHLTTRTLHDSDALGYSLAIADARLKEIAQVVASARTVLQSQVAATRISLAPPVDDDRATAEAAALTFVSAFRSTNSAPSHPDVATTAIAPATPAVDASVRDLLETLPDASQLGTHTGKRLFNALPCAKITKTPRSGTRGDALLYVLSRYGRNRSLSIADLEFAFKTMNVPLGNAPSYHRVVSWEIRELIRRGWPITEDSSGFRFDGASAEGTMT